MKQIALIVEDEPRSRITLRNLLGKYCPAVEVIAEASSVEQGTAAIIHYKPDIVFLDVRLNEGTSFDILNNFKEFDFKIVFTTAYDNYALQAFKYHAIDYLLKPIDPDQLIELSERLEKIIKVDELVKKLSNKEENRIQKLAIKSNNGTHYIDFHDLIRCEADSNYTNFYLSDGCKIVSAKSLKEYEETLTGNNFLRVHKSHLVNLEYVVKFESSSSSIVLKNGTHIEVARRRKESLISLMKNL